MSHSFPSDREIVITRFINAPRARVYAAWIGPDIDAWWGPTGFANETSSRDVRPGGEWHYLMKHAEYGTFPNRVRYLEVGPERIVYDHDGGADDPTPAFRVTVEFIDHGARTEVRLHTVFASAEAAKAAIDFHAIEGGEQTLGRAAEWIEAAG